MLPVLDKRVLHIMSWTQFLVTCHDWVTFSFTHDRSSAVILFSQQRPSQGMLHVLAGWSGTCNSDVFQFGHPTLLCVYGCWRTPPNCVDQRQLRPTTRGLKKAHSRGLSNETSLTGLAFHGNTHEIYRYLIFLKVFQMSQRGDFNKQGELMIRKQNPPAMLHSPKMSQGPPSCRESMAKRPGDWPLGNRALESTVFNKEICDFDNFSFPVSFFIFHLSCVIRYDRYVCCKLQLSQRLFNPKSSFAWKWPCQGAVLIFVVEVRPRVSFKGCSAPTDPTGDLHSPRPRRVAVPVLAEDGVKRG